MAVVRYRPLLHRAGLIGRLRPEEVFGLKVLLGSGATVAFLPLFARGSLSGVAVLAAALAGFFLPDIWLRVQIAARRRQAARTLPDFVDLLAATVSAGLSMDAAIDRIVRRFPGPLAEEFRRYLWEVQLGQSRSNALFALADRIGSDDLRLLAMALTQADLFGLPVANVLRAQAEDLRDRRFQRARERARRAPMLMLPAIALCFCPVMMLLLFTPLVLRLRAAGLLRVFGF
jgi:tight adherence protein C